MSNTAITEREEYWLDHIQATDKHKGTLVEYAKVEGLKVKDLYQWKTLLARRGVLAVNASKPGFVPVRSMAPAKAALILPNGARLELFGGIGAENVKALVQAASELC